ncbi:hypothetical protein QE357_001951 [Siphonobacter sp. BAB-5404]|nr:hypothetical protein [Siphonobacter sp. SORGH_AS_0500]
MNRRTFLESTSKASLAFSAVPLLSSFVRTEKYKTALIGSGWLGHEYPTVCHTGGAIESSCSL